MRTYRFKEHRADLKMIARASSLQELYAGALEGMNEYLVPEIIAGTKGKVHLFHITSPDETALFIDWLSHVLTATLIDRISYQINEIIFDPGGSVHGKLSGDPVNGMDKEIKAVTYHDAYVKKLKTGIWEAQVIFDI